MLLVGVTLLTAGAGPSLAASLSASPSVSADGVYQLTWPQQGAVVLEEARRDDFSDARPVYAGRDAGATLSGKPDGTYYYRLRGASEATSEAARVRVDVQHHPLSRALGFFAVGAAVFVSTVALIVRGGRAEGG